MENGINECIIGVGSNINPEKNIQAAVAILKQETKVKGISTWVTTTPIGITHQNNFINGAIKIHTSKARKELKNYLRTLENRLGRNRTLPKFGPRVIDLDIIVWNNEIIDDDYYTRGFVRNAVDELNNNYPQLPPIQT